MLDKVGVKEYEDLIREYLVFSQPLAGAAEVRAQDGLNKMKASALKRWPSTRGLQPKLELPF